MAWKGGDMLEPFSAERTVRLLIDEPEPVLTYEDQWDRALFGGMRPGLNFLGGAPGQGKSALGIQIALNVAMNRRDVLYATLEMDPLQVWLRMLSCFMAKNGGKPIEWSRSHLLAVDEKRAMESGEIGVASRGFEIMERSLGGRMFVTDNISTVQDLADAASEFDTPPFVVVDYIQLLKFQGQDSSATEYERIGAVVDYLKDWTKRNRCVVLALAALNRESNKGKGDSMHGFKGNGDIEYAGVCTMSVRTPEDGVNVREIVITKHRYGPATDEPIACSFDAAHNYFEF